MVEKVQIAGVIIEKDGKILMHKRRYFPRFGKIDFVGGFVRKNETPEEAAIREAKEETGHEIRVIKRLVAYDYFQDVEKTLHLYLAEIVGGKLKKQSWEGKPLWISSEERSLDILAFPHTVELLELFFKKERTR